MNDSSINASFWTMIVLQTLGSVDPMPGTGNRKMPAPGVYVPVIIAWSVLQVGADIGFEDGAAKFGWLMVLAGVVLGPFGKRLINMFNWISSEYGPVNLTGSTTAPDNAYPGGGNF